MRHQQRVTTSFWLSFVLEALRCKSDPNKLLWARVASVASPGFVGKGKQGWPLAERTCTCVRRRVTTLCFKIVKAPCACAYKKFLLSFSTSFFLCLLEAFGWCLHIFHPLCPKGLFSLDCLTFTWLQVFKWTWSQEGKNLLAWFHHWHGDVMDYPIYFLSYVGNKEASV